MQDDAKPDLVVQIARIIDPSSWTVMDSYLEETKRKYRGQNVAWPEDQFQHKESMAKAREILDAIDAHPPAPAQPADVERIKALEAALKGRPSRWDYDRIASYDDAVRNWEAQALAALGQGGVR